MKAAVMNEYGGPEVLVYADYPDPKPGEGELLLKVAAASVNPVDLFQRAGETRAYLPVTFPGVIGWDVSGTVLEIGPGVTDFSVGGRVLAWAFQTYAELCVVKASITAKVPAGVDLVEAAALPLVTTTGSQLISVGSGLQREQTVLVSGAVGGVARAAVRTAKDMGAIVWAGVRSNQLEEARQVGADEVFALDDEASWNDVPQVDVVANIVRGETAQRLLSKVKRGGTFVSATGAPENAASFPEVKVVSFVSKQNPETLQYMAGAVAQGSLKIPIFQKMPLSEARQAHERVEAGAPGKILLIP